MVVQNYSLQMFFYQSWTCVFANITLKDLIKNTKSAKKISFTALRLLEILCLKQNSLPPDKIVTDSINYAAYVFSLILVFSVYWPSIKQEQNRSEFYALRL